MIFSRFISFWHLLAGLPSLAIGVALVGLLRASGALDDADLRDRYLRAADRAFQQKQFDVARTYYTKYLTLGLNSPEARFRLALCREQLGQVAGAEALLAPMLEPGPQGFAPAHMLRARHLLSRPDRTPAMTTEAITQLELALERQPNLTEAQWMLADLYWAAGRRAEAKKELVQAAEQKPAFHLIVAKLCSELGQPDEVKLHARKALEYFQPLMEADYSDEGAVIGCCEAHLQLEQYAAAEKLLGKALALHDRPRYREALGATFAAWAEATAKRDPKDTATWFVLLERGLRVAPNNGRLLQAFIDLSHQTGLTGKEAKAALERLLVDGQPSATLHLLLGMDALKRGDLEASQFHMERARRLSPDTALLSNNLAFILSKQAEPDLPRALALAESAVKSVPNDPHFRDTRGQILVKMGRYQDALDDLEFAQKAMNDNADLHTAMAVAYEKLGQATLADEHRRRAGKKVGP